jgi:predicted outer membrane repeat protein
MARSNLHLRVAAVALPFLFLAMSGLARAVPPNFIVVNTTFGQSVAAVPGPCSLTDAVAAANSGTTVQNCAGASGATNVIEFSVTGTINLGPAQTLTITTADPVEIIGPTVGGITINGDSSNLRILKLQPGTDVTLENLTFADGGNSSFLVFGGGAILSEGTSLTIENSTFVSNVAEDGGAIFADSGTVTITNSTFFSNLGLFGGAIYNDGATLLLTNDTFDANTAENDGGSLYSNNPVTKYKATLFAGGSPNNCAATAGADQQDIGFNISSDASCAFTMGSSNVESPGLDPAGLANNGGPTKTIKLVSGANAIGHDTDCTDQEITPQPVLIDQRLFNRPNSPAKCDSGAYERDALPSITLVPNTERVAIAHSSTPNSDQISLAFSFVDNGPGVGIAQCDAGTNALNGIDVDLFKGTCASLATSGLLLDLSPFVLHTVNHQTYGTLFQMQPNPFLQQPGETVSARIVALTTPANACGEWSLNIAVAGLNTTTLGLAGGNPFALVLQDGDKNVGCFDITNAVVGGQIPPPTRGARRGRR